MRVFCLACLFFEFEMAAGRRPGEAFPHPEMTPRRFLFRYSYCTTCSRAKPALVGQKLSGSNECRTSPPPDPRDCNLLPSCSLREMRPRWRDIYRVFLCGPFFIFVVAFEMARGPPASPARKRDAAAKIFQIVTAQRAVGQHESSLSRDYFPQIRASRGPLFSPGS